MKQFLSARSDEWRLIRLHGPSGIGKTALLQQFEALHADESLIVYADCSGYDSVEDLFNGMGESLSKYEGEFGGSLVEGSEGVRLAERLNRIGRSTRSQVFLLIDAIEQGDAFSRKL